MKKVFLFLLFVILLNAQESSKSIENEKKLEDDSKKKLIELQQRVKKAQERTEALNKLEKTVGELNGKLGIKK
ncbi:MAG: hypothetical protein NTW78_11510 [Campylobacterales bacterium]|nr:hypothetical protein [Campylobacterales bacterium]